MRARVVAGALGVATAMLTSSFASQADGAVTRPFDPGRCGVSVYGPMPSSATELYAVRNQCPTAQILKVHSYTYNKNSACAWVEPGAIYIFALNVADHTWQAIPC